MFGWQNRFLSPGGKEVLLKAIALALPTYTMSCFLLPKTICKQIISLMSEFWWRNNRESRGMHWKCWHHLTQSKDKGGLGFKNLEDFNVALLGKQLWRLITHPDSLLCRVFKTRYFRPSDPLNATLGFRPSYAWRSMIAAQTLIKQGARVVIGNGRSTKLWEERWIGSMSASMVTSTKQVSPQLKMRVAKAEKVCDLMTQTGREWDMELIRNIFPDETQERILAINPQGIIGEDTYTWDFSKTGHYTVKSGYWVQRNVINVSQKHQGADQPSLDGLYQQIWKLSTSPKIHHFIWRCVSDALPTAATMRKRHISKDGSCGRCAMDKETANHILFKCPYARLVWALSPICAPPNGEWPDSLCANLYRVMNHKQHPHPEFAKDDLVPWLLWRIWKNRNDYLFKGVDHSAPNTIDKALEDME